MNFYFVYSLLTMSTIYSLTNSVDKVGVHYFKYGYQAAPEAAMLMYDLELLNKDTIDWKNLKLKNLATKISMTPDGESVTWYEEDLQKATAAITVVTSTTVFETGASIVAGEILFNRNTKTTYVVSSVSGAAITITAADASAAVGDVLVRMGFSKLYGADSSFTPTRNALTDSSNYVHFSEYLIPSDMIENNKSRIFLKDGKEYAESKITDAAREAVWNSVTNFYTGIKAKVSASGTYRYAAGGLDYFIPSGYKVNIKGADAAGTKANIRTQLEVAYGSGVEGVYDANNMMFFCNSKMASKLSELYEDKVIINDELKAIGMNLKTINLEGRKLTIVESSVINTFTGNAYAVGYFFPLKDTFMFNVYNRVLDSAGKMMPNGFGVMYQKSITNLETVNNALATAHSFIFGTVNSGAYQRWIYA